MLAHANPHWCIYTNSWVWHPFCMGKTRLLFYFHKLIITGGGCSFSSSCCSHHDLQICVFPMDFEIGPSATGWPGHLEGSGLLQLLGPRVDWTCWHLSGTLAGLRSELNSMRFRVSAKHHGNTNIKRTGPSLAGSNPWGHFSHLQSTSPTTSVDHIFGHTSPRGV